MLSQTSPGLGAALPCRLALFGLGLACCGVALRTSHVHQCITYCAAAGLQGTVSAPAGCCTFSSMACKPSTFITSPQAAHLGGIDVVLAVPVAIQGARFLRWHAKP